MDNYVSLTISVNFQGFKLEMYKSYQRLGKTLRGIMTGYLGRKFLYELFPEIYLFHSLNDGA